MAAPTIPTLPEARVKSVWDSKLDADLNQQYWHETTSVLSHWDKAIKVFIAITSSATIGTTLTPVVPAATWKVLGVITALVSIFNAVYLGSDHIAFASNLAGKWKEELIELDLLWGKLSRPVTDDEWKRFEEIRRTELAIDETKHRINRKRLNSIFESIRKRHSKS
jgi:hypothetical protein